MQIDLLFLESPEVILKMAIALLDIHKDELMQCGNFEEIMGYLKTSLPQITAPILELVLKKVCY